MKRYITLLVSCITFFVPLLTRAEILKEEFALDKIVKYHSRQNERDESLFARLKEVINPGNFKAEADNSGMRFSP